MITDINSSIEELQKRVDDFKENDPTEEELRKFSEDFLLVRSALRQLDGNLTKCYDDYWLFYEDWAYRHENELQERVNTWVKRTQLEICFEH